MKARTTKLMLTASGAILAGLLATSGANAATIIGQCIPEAVGQVNPEDAIYGRVHVKCQSPIYDGATPIYWFSLPLNKKNLASRGAPALASIGTSAMITRMVSATGHIQFSFISGDTSGASYGCDAGNCRKPVDMWLARN